MVLGKPQTDPTLEWFLSHCHIHKYPSKSTLIHAGEKAETLYYIVKGIWVVSNLPHSDFGATNGGRV